MSGTNFSFRTHSMYIYLRNQAIRRKRHVYLASESNRRHMGIWCSGFSHKQAHKTEQKYICWTSDTCMCYVCLVVYSVMLTFNRMDARAIECTREIKPKIDRKRERKERERTTVIVVWRVRVWVFFLILLPKFHCKYKQYGILNAIFGKFKHCDR